MYAGSKLELEKRAEVHKVYELCDLDDLCLDWLKEKLAKWKPSHFKDRLPVLAVKKVKKEKKSSMNS